MPNFDKQDKFDPTKQYTGLNFGENAPLLEVELNELQKIQNHARAELIRNMVHSGVIDYNPSIVNTNSGVANTGQVRVGITSFNNMVALGETTAIINGHNIKVKDFRTTQSISSPQNAISLPEPPTEGTRDDLVFLEAWFEEVDSVKDPAIKDARIGEETSRRTKLNWRIRTVAGVDFKKFPEGLGVLASLGQEYQVIAQGGNTEPIVPSSAALHAFWRSGHIYESNLLSSPSMLGYNAQFTNDKGIFISGTGQQSSKDALKTADGYVYAIPLFRVKRRNVGEYSQNNGNGARIFKEVSVYNTASASYIGKLATDYTGGQLTINLDQINPNCDLRVGDRIAYGGSTNIRTVTAINGTIITLNDSFYPTNLKVADNIVVHIRERKSDRPDGKFANIIHQDDIIDLRHKVSLTGVNYDQLLEENFDKLTRGDLRTKEGQKLLKTYHGVPKTPIDANHVFYASLDGTNTPERGTATSNTLSRVGSMPTGNGLVVNANNRFSTLVPFTDELTVEGWFEREGLMKDASGNVQSIIEIFHESSSRLISLYGLAINSGKTSWRAFNGGTNSVGYASIDKVEVPPTKYVHIRVVISNSKNTISVYLNGKLVHSSTLLNKLPSTGNVNVSLGLNTGGWTYDGLVSDVAVSNIDRGANFATLPKDFIDGYAVIDKAFNMQRRNFSDAQISQLVNSFAKPKAQISSKGITVEKGTGVNTSIWESGDKIKVKGFSGEIISGIIDTDTALATIASVVNGAGTGSSSVEVILNDTGKLAVGDVAVVHYNNGTISTSGEITRTFTVTAIDTATKKVTFALSHPLGSDATSLLPNSYVYETTPSTSSPVVVTSTNGNTTSHVAGTWTGLGTNEATFTLSENVDLDTEDIRVSYSLNSPNGQGGISELLTETLQGEYKGVKLVKGAPTLRADYRGKVSGSVVENPHIFARRAGTTIVAPDQFTTELTTENYTDLVNGKTVGFGGSTSTGYKAQYLFKFDVVAEVERQLGRPIPRLTLIDKVLWLRQNLQSVLFNFSGYGTSSGGSKVTLNSWAFVNSQWLGNTASHSQATPAPLTSLITAFGSYLDDKGFISFVAHAEPADGAINTAIFVNSATLNIEFKTPTGYDALTPENPLHDGRQKNFLFIRKETKEIESFVNCGEGDGVVTWGNYVPYQGLNSVLNGTILKVRDTALITTLGTGRMLDVEPSVSVLGLSTRLPSYTPDHMLLAEDIMLTPTSTPVYMANVLLQKDNKAYMRSTDGKLASFRATFKEGLRLQPGTDVTNSASVIRGSKSRPTVMDATMVSSSISQSVANFDIPLKVPVNALLSLPMIISVDGEVYLAVISYQTKNPKFSLYSTESVYDLFKIEGKPLLKGV